MPAENQLPSFRILILGDSLTEGYGVLESEAYLESIGRKVKQRAQSQNQSSLQDRKRRNKRSHDQRRRFPNRMVPAGETGLPARGPRWKRRIGAESQSKK